MRPISIATLCKQLLVGSSSGQSSKHIIDEIADVMNCVSDKIPCAPNNSSCETRCITQGTSDFVHVCSQVITTRTCGKTSCTCHGHLTHAPTCLVLLSVGLLSIGLLSVRGLLSVWMLPERLLSIESLLSIRLLRASKANLLRYTGLLSIRLVPEGLLAIRSLRASKANLLRYAASTKSNWLTHGRMTKLSRMSLLAMVIHRTVWLLMVHAVRGVSLEGFWIRGRMSVATASTHLHAEGHVANEDNVAIGWFEARNVLS